MQLRTSPRLLSTLLLVALSSGCDIDSASGEATYFDPDAESDEQVEMVLDEITLDHDDVVLMLFNQDADDEPASIDALTLVINDS